MEPIPERELGAFAYRLAGANSVFGEFTIEADTVAVEAQTHACRPLSLAPNFSHTHPFRCGGGRTAITVVVDSKHPQLSTWHSLTPVPKTTKICTHYEYSNGKSTCIGSRTELTTEMVRIGGRLDVTRLASTDKP